MKLKWRVIHLRQWKHNPVKIFLFHLVSWSCKLKVKLGFDMLLCSAFQHADPTSKLHALRIRYFDASCCYSELVLYSQHIKLLFSYVCSSCNWSPLAYQPLEYFCRLKSSLILIPDHWKALEGLSKNLEVQLSSASITSKHKALCWSHIKSCDWPMNVHRKSRTISLSDRLLSSISLSHVRMVPSPFRSFWVLKQTDVFLIVIRILILTVRKPIARKY